MARTDAEELRYARIGSPDVKTAAIQESSVVKDRKVREADRMTQECQRPNL